MFKLHSGRTKSMYFGSTASQAISKGALVALSSGRLIPAANDTDPSVIVGVIDEAIASTDTAYATAGTPVKVIVPLDMWTTWEVDLNATGGASYPLTATDQGEYMDLYTDDTGLYVDTNVSTLDTLFCVGYINTLKGLFVLNIGPYYMNP